jgi:flagellin
MITAINSFREAIGVSAAQHGVATDRIVFRSVGFGADEFVRVKELAGPAADYIFSSAAATTALDDRRDFGRDAIVTINGQQATANGTEARVVTGGFDVFVDIDGTSALNTGSGSGTNSTDFTITGGGANFNLSPNVNLAGKVSLGIETVTTGNIGKAGTGFLSSLAAGGLNNVVNGDLTTAQTIIDESIKQISSLRGRLGAFAAETAALTRSQILGQAATQALAIANAQPTSILALLQ